MRRWISAALLLVVSVPALAQGEVSEATFRQCVHLTQKGVKALQAGNLKRASEQYAKVLDRVPSFYDAHIGLGHVAMQQRRFEDALDHFAAARDTYRDIADLLYAERSRTFEKEQRQLNQLYDQRSDLERITDRAQRTGSASGVQGDLARVERNIQQLEARKRPVRESSETVPGEVYFLIGNALNRLDRFDEALQSWERSVEIDHEFPLVHVNLAVAYWKLERLEDARRHLGQAESLGVQVNPQFKNAVLAAQPTN